MSRTLLEDKDHWIATEGDGSESSELTVLRLADKVLLGSATVPLDKLKTALRRAPSPRRSWDDFFLDMAALIASRSKDPSTKVGAVIVDMQRRVVSMGYNGFPRGVNDSQERLGDRTKKYPMTLHAEVNAILFAERELKGGTVIYIWPSPPCTRCAAMIIQAGIDEVVCPPPSKDMLSRWKEELDMAKELLNEAMVGFDYVGEAVEP